MADGLCFFYRGEHWCSLQERYSNFERATEIVPSKERGFPFVHGTVMTGQQNGFLLGFPNPPGHCCPEFVPNKGFCFSFGWAVEKDRPKEATAP